MDILLQEMLGNAHLMLGLVAESEQPVLLVHSVCVLSKELTLWSLPQQKP